MGMEERVDTCHVCIKLFDDWVVRLVVGDQMRGEWRRDGRNTGEGNALHAAEHLSKPWLSIGIRRDGSIA